MPPRSHKRHVLAPPSKQWSHILVATALGAASEEEGAATSAACMAFLSFLLASTGSPFSSLSESTMSTTTGFLTATLDAAAKDKGATIEEEGMSCLAFFFTGEDEAGKAFFSILLAAASCFSIINVVRCFSFLVMMVAFCFNPSGAVGTAFFLKAGVFLNPDGGLTSSFTAAEDKERRTNLPVFSSLRVCCLSGLIIFDGGGCGYGYDGGPGR